VCSMAKNVYTDVLIRGEDGLPGVRIHFVTSLREVRSQESGVR
jgi:hypothetical protein